MTEETDRPIDDERLEHLLLLASQGDSDALNELFAHQRMFLRAFADKQFDSRLSLSAFVQEALFDAFQNLSSLRSVSAPAFRLWLLQILRRRIYRHLREKKQLKRRPPNGEEPQSADQVADDSPLPDVAAEYAEQRAQVGQRIQSLNSLQQQIVFLRFFEGLSQSQIAAELDITIDSLEGHLRRIKSKLRGMLPSLEP